MILLYAGLALAASEAELEIARGEAALREGRAADAREHATAALERAPDAPDAHLLYLASCDALEVTDLCESVWDGLGAVHPVAKTALTWHRARTGRGSALTLGLSGSDPVVSLALADVSIADGDPEVALAVLAESTHPLAAELGLAALAAEGDVAALVKGARAVMKGAPAQPDALSPLFHSLPPERSLEKARVEALAAARAALAQNDPAVAYRVLELALAAKSTALADEAAARLVQMGEPAPRTTPPLPPEQRQRVAKGLAQARNPVIPPGPEAAATGVLVAELLLKMGRVDEALAVYADLRAAQDSADLAADHGALLLRSGRAEPALKAGDDAVRLASIPDPDDPFGRHREERLAAAHGLRAAALWRLQRHDDALLAATVAAAFDPKGEGALLLGELYQERGAYPAAFAVFARAHALGNSAAARKAAETWDGPGDWEDAAAIYAPQSPSLEATAPRPRRAALGAAAPTLGKFDPGDLQGQIVVYAFFAAWCAPCHEELPAYAAIARELRGQGAPVRFIAVSLDDREKEFTRFVGKTDLDGITPIWAPQLGPAFRVTELPTTWVADREGILRWRHTGYGRGDEQELSDAIRELLPD